MFAESQPIIEQSHGCEFCQLLQSHDNPNEFVVVELWESVEAHQASVKNISQEKIKKVMSLLAASPVGGYYSSLTK